MQSVNVDFSLSPVIAGDFDLRKFFLKTLQDF